jgi:hypothetical protein
MLDAISLLTPKYRHHKAKNLAVVSIRGQNIYLGKYGAAASEQKYRRLVSVDGCCPTRIRIQEPPRSLLVLWRSAVTTPWALCRSGETTDRVINLPGTTAGGAIDSSGTSLPLVFSETSTATMSLMPPTMLFGVRPGHHLHTSGLRRMEGPLRPNHRQRLRCHSECRRSRADRVTANCVCDGCLC